MIKVKEITKEEQENIKGGEMISVWTGIVIASIAVFLSGIIEGITNPGRCNG